MYLYFSIRNGQPSETAPAVWNSLPQTVLSSDSVAVFKLKLKTSLFSLLAPNWAHFLSLYRFAIGRCLLMSPIKLIGNDATCTSCLRFPVTTSPHLARFTPSFLAGLIYAAAGGDAAVATITVATCFFRVPSRPFTEVERSYRSAPLPVGVSRFSRSPGRH